ncbi:MAG: OadG family protein [Parabacteroides sp.]|nr:OadG family protein [Parabacteroides sp.]
MENLGTGLLLMAVGMTTVFVILLIVIYLGKGLIILVNKYAPEEEKIQPSKNSIQTNSPSNIPNEEVAAIISAVSIITRGRGKITKIEKA